MSEFENLPEWAQKIGNQQYLDVDTDDLLKALDRALEALYWYAADVTIDREAIEAIKEIKEMGA